MADETDVQGWSRLLFLVCERMERLGISAEEALSRESDRMIECFLEMQHRIVVNMKKAWLPTILLYQEEIQNDQS